MLNWPQVKSTLNCPHVNIWQNWRTKSLILITFIFTQRCILTTYIFIQKCLNNKKENPIYKTPNKL